MSIMRLVMVTGALAVALFLTTFAAMAMFVLVALDPPHDWIMATVVMSTVVIMFVVQMRHESHKS